MEKQARQAQVPLALRAMTILDPVLEPAQRNLFKVVSQPMASGPLCVGTWVQYVLWYPFNTVCTALDPLTL